MPALGRNTPGCGRSGRAEYTSANDAEAWTPVCCWRGWKASFPLWSRPTPWRKPQTGSQMRPEEILVINISGRGDKDMGILQEALAK